MEPQQHHGGESNPAATVDPVFQGSVVMMGPCGGAGGDRSWKMDMRGVNRVVKVFVRHHDGAVHAICVVFERDGLTEWTDLWGGQGIPRSEIDLQPGEYLTSVKGHYGQLGDRVVIRSLTFVSNRNSFGPYGKEEGVPFELPAAGGKILGFHARSGGPSGGLLHALGTYVKMGSVVRMGPCGGTSGDAREMDMRGVNRVVRVVVNHSSDVVNAIKVLYEQDGREEWTARWGGQYSDSSDSEIDLQPDKYLTSVKGHYGQFERWVVIRSLTFVGNHRSFGPYGKEEGVPFELPAGGGGKILGFHARSGGRLDALGTYVKMP